VDLRWPTRKCLAHLGPPDQSTASPQFHCSIMHRRGRRDDSSIEIVL
jgi:hypothetical protein